MVKRRMCGSADMATGTGTCLENLEMSGNLKHVRKMSGKSSSPGEATPV